MADKQQNNNGNVALGLGGAILLGSAGLHHLADEVMTPIRRMEHGLHKAHTDASVLGVKRNVAKDFNIYHANRTADLKKHIAKLEAAKQYRQKGKMLLGEFKKHLSKDIGKAKKYADELDNLHNKILNDKRLKGKKLSKGSFLNPKWAKSELEGYTELAKSTADEMDELQNKLNTANKHTGKYKEILKGLNKKQQILRLGGKAALGLGTGALLVGAYNKLKDN